MTNIKKNENEEKAKSQKVDFADLIPKEWIEKDGTVSAMQSVYTCYFFDPADAKLPYLHGIIEEVVYMVVHLAEGMSFNQVENSIEVVGGVPQFHITVNKNVTKPGTHIIFFTKYKEGGSVSEPEARARIESA